MEMILIIPLVKRGGISVKAGLYFKRKHEIFIRCQTVRWAVLKVSPPKDCYFKGEKTEI